MDAVVVGGGVIGCSVAWELAQGGMRVVLVERDPDGSNASWAAAGMLSPQAEADRPGPFLELLLASREMYPGFVAGLEAGTGAEVGYRAEGTLVVALTETDEEEIEGRFRWQTALGLEVELMDAAAALRLEPALSQRVRAALRFSGDHQVDNRRLAPALREAARTAGVEMRLGDEVVRVLARHGKVEGVEMRDGSRIAARTVVVAGGAASAGLAGLPGPLPVRPVHGQLLALRPGLGVRHVVDSPRGYLVPRDDGRLIVGATVEETGFERSVTAGGVRSLLEAAIEIIPLLAHAPIAEIWSGHRPGTPDDLPILGPDRRLPGLVYATGHYRNGILLTPVTARIVADVVLERAGGYDYRPFSIDRFFA